MKALSRRVQALAAVGTLGDLERKSWLITAERFEHFASDADAEIRRIAKGLIAKMRRAARTGVDVDFETWSNAELAMYVEEGENP